MHFGQFSVTLNVLGPSGVEILSLKRLGASLSSMGLVSACLVGAPVANSNPANQAAEYRDLVTALREDNRNAKIVDKLRINTGETFRVVAPNKCEQEGEFELRQLASSSKVEESYILIPSLCLWIEVGHNEKRTSVRLDQKFTNAVLKQYSSLVIYHIQPGEFPSLANNFPAYKDLVTLVLINANLVWNPNIQIKHRAITKIGTIEYKFSNKQKVKKYMNKYREIGLRGYESQNLVYEYTRRKYTKDYYTKIQNCNSHSGSIQQKIINCYPIKTEAFTLIFRPFMQALKLTTRPTISSTR